jgi:hypothetical protein
MQAVIVRVVRLQSEGDLDLAERIVQAPFPLELLGQERARQAVVRHEARARLQDLGCLGGAAAIPAVKLVARHVVVGDGELRVELDGACERAMRRNRITFVVQPTAALNMVPGIAQARCVGPCPRGARRAVTPPALPQPGGDPAPAPTIGPGSRRRRARTRPLTLRGKAGADGAAIREPGRR